MPLSSSGVFSPGDASRDIHIYIGNTALEKQCQFKVVSLCSNFYDKTAGALGRFKVSLEGIRECHMKIWPGVIVPELANDNLNKQAPNRGKKDEAVTVCSSLAFSSIIHMFRHQGRDKRLRLKSYELLRAIVDQAVRQGWQPEVLVFDLQGNAWWNTVQLDGHSCSDELWTLEYRQQRVAFAWSTDLASDKRPWITSTATQPHLADFLAFALDHPASLQAHPELRRTKQELERTSLAIVSQLAVFMDTNMKAFTNPLQSLRIHTKRQRMETAAKWQFIASSLERLVSGQDIRFEQFRTSRAASCLCLWTLDPSDLQTWRTDG